MPDQPRIKIDFVYRGPTLGSDGKTYSRWSRVVKGKVVKELSLFNSKLNQGHVVGQIYTVEAADEEGATIYPGTFAYSGLWPDKEMRVKWEAEAVSSRASIAVLKKQKDESTDALVAQLLPITRAYHGSVGVNRAQLLTRVVEIIVSGREG